MIASFPICHKMYLNPPELNKYAPQNVGHCMLNKLKASS